MRLIVYPTFPVCAAAAAAAAAACSLFPNSSPWTFPSISKVTVQQVHPVLPRRTERQPFQPEVRKYVLPCFICIFSSLTT